MKARLATVWLQGCSGCHMSLLDLDARIIEIAQLVDVVYSPLVDIKEFPEDVDVTFVEGAVNTAEDAARLKRIRECTHVLVALGDCAITGNVPSMRNPFDLQQVFRRAYIENVAQPSQIPNEFIPPLLPRVLPLHAVVHVDAFVPGCPPPPEAIALALTEILAARIPDVHQVTRFGK
ncbi:MAG: NADP oxidoreductase [Chloroflexi bacterium]|nr:NADP oxidoreductase [Chloroflexota bacterium]